MNLSQAHSQLKDALEPIGVEIGVEVMALWMARVREGRPALSAESLRRLADVAEQLAVNIS